MMTSPSDTPRPTWRRRAGWLLVAAGGVLLLLSLLLRLPAMELARLIAGGVLAPARHVMGYAALFGGALLLAAPRVGRWAHGRVVQGLGLVGLLTALWSGWGVRQGPSVATVHYRSGDIDIAGSLYRPAGDGPFPAAIIVHGSAPFRRGFYDQWADSLARRGVAVLVPDKRGVGGSGGEFETRNNAARGYLELLASDVVAGGRFLRTRPEIREDQVGLVGISQGGWVGPLAAAQDSNIAFLVLLSGPATSTGEESVWSRLRGDHDGPALLSFAAANDSLARTIPEGFDPRPILAGLPMPSLWLFGEADNSVPTAKSVAALDSLAATGRPIEWRVFAGADHVMTRHDGPFGLIHTDPASWAVWLDWVIQHVTVSGGR